MVAGRLGQVVRQVRDMALGRRAGGEDDADLLGRYARDRDEAAFAALVRRHGPMVLGVCRRVLRNAADADDAFQATFLVLARRAASLHSPESLSSWLHGVALRAASEARRAATRRRAKEARAVPRLEQAPPDGLGEILDEELVRLPERYRLAIVLCDLEGKSRQEAARDLGWAEGTVASRLARGRARLGRRLLRRGLGPVTTLVVPAAVPPRLAAAAVRTVLSVGADPASAGPAVSLAETVLRTTTMMNWKMAGVLVLVAGAVGTYGLFAATGAGREDGPKPPAADAGATADEAKKDLAALQGTWTAVTVERNGQKAPAEVLRTFKVVIQGDRMTINPDSDNRTSTFKLNPANSPKWMDNTPQEGPAKGKSLPAIYELKGDTLKICFDNEGVSDERPKEFKTAPRSGLSLFVLKREQKARP